MNLRRRRQAGDGSALQEQTDPPDQPRPDDPGDRGPASPAAGRRRQPPDSAQHFTEMLDINLNQYGFCETHKFTPLQTTHSGVFVCGAFSSPKEISETIIDASGAAAEVMRLLNEKLNTYPFSRESPFLAQNGLPPWPGW